MASVTRHKTRQLFRIVYFYEGQRKEWYVPIGDGLRAERSAKVQAVKIGDHLDELTRSKATGDKPADGAIEWVGSLDTRSRAKLVGLGLVRPASEKLSSDAGRMLGPFLDSYIDSRTDVAAKTVTNYRQTRRLLVEYFTEEKPLASITPADCERWKRWLLGRIVAKAKFDKQGNELTKAKTMAQPTVSKHVKRAKTMFADAVGDRLIDFSPFDAVKAGSDKGKPKHHLDHEASVKILKACPDADWRCVFALARWGGLRRDCEIQRLKWTDIDWEAERINIHSGKTGLRQCPLFPELKAELLEASELAPRGSVYVAGRLATHSNLAHALLKIVNRAGLPKWPKAFNALRATRATELRRTHPDHVVNAWLGHSADTAKDYYVQLTDADWKLATAARPNICPNIGKESDTLSKVFTTSSNHQANKKPSKTHAVDGSRGLENVRPVTPMGFEPMLPP